MLKSIEISGFRSCDQTKLCLGQSVNSLVGRNGVGKTSILKCIEWVAKSAISPSPLDLSSSGSAEKVPHPDIAIVMRIEIELASYIYSIEYTWPNKDQTESGGLFEDLAVQKASKPRRLVFRRERDKIRIAGKTGVIRVPRFTPAIAALTALLPPSHPGHDHVATIKAYFGRVSYYQFAEMPATDDSVHEVIYKNWLNTRADQTSQTTSIALRLAYMLEEDKAMLEEFKALVGPKGLGLVKFVSIAKADLSELARSEPILPGHVYLPVFALPDDAGGGARNLFQISKLPAGTRRAIQIVISMLFDARSLVLMEHPEESLHPGLLHKLIDVIRSYSHRYQILFSTHSPDVLDTLRPEELILVTAQNGRTRARNLAPREIQAARKFLTDEGSLSEFLEPLEGSE